MKNISVKELIAYWRATAEHDYETMLGLFKIKRYSDCLFYGHIVLEKVLKGLVVRETKEQAPYVHNLLRLSEIACLELTDDQIDLLDKVNIFNLRCRYPEDRLQFYKLCTKEYTENYFKKIVKLYKKLCHYLAQKK